METRQLGASSLRVPVLSLGTVTFGGCGDVFAGWGSLDANAASRLVDIALDAGLNMFDSADVYSRGLAETILGGAVRGRRGRILLSTKGGLSAVDGRSGGGSSPQKLVEAVNGSLRRLGTDYIDIYHLHAFDLATPVTDVLRTLDDLVRAGKIRYVGASNFSAWQFMKSLSIADRDGLVRYVGYQGYYSLLARDYEWELMPLMIDQGVGTIAWSPLGGARLTSQVARGRPLPAGSRLATPAAAAHGPPVDDGHWFRVLDVLREVSAATGRTVPQVAINWLMHRRTVATVIVGVRNEQQLRDNLGALDWTLSDEHRSALDEVSSQPMPYPYWHARLHS